MQVFLEAAKLSGHSGLYDVQVIGTALGPIGGPCGLSVVPGRTIAGPDEAIDTLLVAGTPQPEIDQAAVAWLVGHAERVHPCGSVGTPGRSATR
jgi:transcriptional regulator GlxA family with amidase domain